MRKVIGFQDGLEISGLCLNNIFVTGQGLRNHTRSLHWELGTFMHNDFMCEGIRMPRWTADKITGYDQGSGGVYAWYGAGAILQSCYGTTIDYIKIENLDGVQLLGEELSSRGTHIGYCEVTWNASNSTVFSCTFFGGTPGSTSLISIDHLVTKGGRHQAVLGTQCKIGTWEDQGPALGSLSYFSFSPAVADRLFIGGQGYRDKKRFEFVIPVPTTASSALTLVPCKGLIRNVNLRITCPSTFAQVIDVGINALAVDGTASGTSYDITSGFITARDTWFTVNPAQTFGASSPDLHGYCQPRILVGSNGTTPAGTLLHVDVEMFLPEMIGQGQVVLSDTSAPHIRGGSGAPASSADFIPQWYLDTVAKTLYVAKSTGSGAADWVAL